MPPCSAARGPAELHSTTALPLIAALQVKVYAQIGPLPPAGLCAVGCIVFTLDSWVTCCHMRVARERRDLVHMISAPPKNDLPLSNFSHTHSPVHLGFYDTESSRVPTTAQKGSPPRPLMLPSCDSSPVPPPSTSTEPKPPAARM